MKLGLSQSELATQLAFEKGTARISEYESGIREPDLLVLLRYAMLARVPMADLVNDKVELRFPKKLKPPNKHELRD